MPEYGKTTIVICEDEQDLGSRAAAAVAATMRERLSKQDELVMILAAGESQITFLDALAAQSDIAWDRTVCFNMDDFWDPRMPEQYTCGYQTRVQLYDKVQPKRTELVRYNAADPEAEALRFEQLLREAAPVDILCQGIGTSGHLALCEPGQIDFGSNRWAEVVPLVEQSKKQLIEDPNFKDLGYIPEKGITFTLPAMLSAAHVFTMVPLALKKPILSRVLSTDSPTTDLPATIIKWHDGTLFCDRNSCPDFLIGEL